MAIAAQGQPWGTLNTSAQTLPMLTCAHVLKPDDLKAAILPNPPMAAPDSSLGEAIAQLAQVASPTEKAESSLITVAPGQARGAAGCLLIVAEGRLLGMLTEQDVIGLLAGGTHPDTPLRQVMGTNPISLPITALTSFQGVDELFQRHPIRHLPILGETGQVLGVITRESLLEQLRFVEVNPPDHPGNGQSDEEFFRNTFDQAAVGIAHVLPNGDFLRANQRFCDIVGYPRSELMTTGFPAITHPADLDLDLHHFTALLAGQQGTYSVEKRYIRQDGSLVWTHLTVSLVRTPQGEPWYCIGVIEDISQRKAAEHELEQQRDFSRLMAELTSSFVDISLDDLPAALNRTLRQIGQTSLVDTSYIVEFSTPLEQADFARDTLSITHEWCQPPYPRQQALVQQVPLAAFPWAMAQLRQRQVVYVASVDDLPPAAATDQSHWRRFNLTSVLSVPLVQNAEVIGLMGFACFDRPARWNDHAIQLLQVMGQTIANARERLQAQMQLQQSEQRFKRAVLDTPYPIIIHAEDGEILQINQAWTQISGYTPGDIPTIADWTEYAYGHRQGPVKEIIDQLYAVDGPVNDGEFTIRTKTGDERIWDFSSAPLGRLPDGRRYVLSIAVDITDRKLAEAERLNSQKMRLELKLLETILDVILAGYWDWHIPTQQNYLSPGLKQMLGYGDDELPQAPNTWQRLIFPEDLPLALESFQRHVESGGQQPYTVEVRYRHKQGSTVWVLCSGQVIEWDEDGKPQYVVGCHVDITQRKQAELKLQKSEAHFKTAQRIGKIGSWEFDVNTGQITWSNEVFRIFGLDPAAGPPSYEELLQLYLPEDAREHHRIVQEALALGQPYDLECRGWHPDGTLFYIQARGEPVFDHNGTLTLLVGTILDITQRKQAEAKLLQMAAQLQASNQELEAFAYSVSHDLRSPLRAIDGFSQALWEDYGHLFDPDGLDFFHRIRSNVSRMGTLIDDLLRLSRVSRTEMQYRKVNLSALVANHLAELHTTEPQRQVRVTIAPDVIVCADPALMQVAITNLLDNAWKFTSHHPTAHIEFGTQAGEDQPVYFIRDDGAGFDMAYGDMLFGVFQRLHNANEFPGTGIGLATVQRVIHRHGGQVWADAAVEQGATVYFTLPVASTLGD